MEIGEYKLLSPRCGYARILDEKGEDWYVVAAHNFDISPIFDDSIGNTLGKGKTLIEAFENALDWTTNRIFDFSLELEKRVEGLKELSDFISNDLYRDKNNIKIEIHHSVSNHQNVMTEYLSEAEIKIWEGKAEIGIS